MADQSTSVRISADISGLVAGLSGAAGALRSFAAEAKAAGASVDSMGRQSRALSQVGQSATAAGTAVASAGTRSKAATDSAAASAERQASSMSRAGAAASSAASATAAGAARATSAASQTTAAVERQGGAWSRISGAVQGAGAAVTSYGSRAAASVSQALAAVEKNATAWNRVGNTMLGVGALAAAGLGLSAKAAMDWQQQFTGVTKTVDGTAAQFKVLEGELRGMARTMPATHQEIAGVAEAAGQLGVKTEDVSKFTKTMVMMGVATNLSSEEAATGIAQFMNIMGTVPQNVDRVAATIVKLGNNGASTEKQILEMGQRIAGAGNQVHMSEGQVLAYANALASVGINAEAGGTAMSKTFIKLDQATRQGGDRLQALNRIAGTDFKKAFQEDAAGATHALIQGLGRIQASGGDVAGALAEIGIKGQYERDAMTRLAGATLEAGAAQDVLGNSLKDGAVGWAENTALINEYTKFSDTAQSKAKVAWNNIKDSMISAGQAALPAISSLASGISSLAQMFGSLSPATLKAGAAVAATVAALGLVGGAVVKAVVGLAELRGALVALGATKLASSLVPDIAGTIAALKGGALAAVDFKSKLAGIAAAAVGFMAVQAAADGLGDAFRKGTATAQDYEASLTSVGRSGAGSMRDLDASFAKMGDTWAMAGRGIKDTDTAFKALRESSGAVARGFKAIGDTLGMDSSLKLLSEEFDKVDKSLVNMKPLEAAAAFRQLSASASRAGIDMGGQLRIFDDYGNKLQAVAVEMTGSKVSAQELYEWMGGKVPDAVLKAAEASPEAAKALEKVGQSAQDSAGQLKAMIEATQTLGNEMLAMSGSQIGVEAAIASANKALQENGRNLDITTEKGRANQSALNELAQSGMKYVQTLADQGKGTDEQAAALQRARDEYMRIAQAMGMSKDKAEEWADAAFSPVAGMKSQAQAAAEAAQASGELAAALKGIPPETKIGVNADGLPPVAGTIAEIRQQIESLPADRKIEVTLPNGEHVATTVGELKARIDQLPPEKRTNISAPGADQAAAQAQSLQGKLAAIPPDKRISVYQDGVINVTGSLEQVRAGLEKIPPERVIRVTMPNGEVRATAGEIKADIDRIQAEKQVNINASTNAPQVAGQASGAMENVRNVDRQIAVETNAQGTASNAQGAMNGVRDTNKNIHVATNAPGTAGQAQGAMNGVRDANKNINVQTNAGQTASFAQSAMSAVQSVTRFITTIFRQVGAPPPGNAAGGMPIEQMATPEHYGSQAKHFVRGGSTGSGAQGRRKRDDIPAWLSIQEFVQPDSAVDYYGLGVMEAMRHRRIPKEAFSPFGFASGGTAEWITSTPGGAWFEHGAGWSMPHIEAYQPAAPVFTPPASSGSLIDYEALYQAASGGSAGPGDITVPVTIDGVEVMRAVHRAEATWKGR